MLASLNHLTFAVQDLERSVDFYHRLLGLDLRAQWDTGAYLSVGELWLCLSHDPLKADGPGADYTHYAFSIPQVDFNAFVRHLRHQGVAEWRKNSSEGDSVYFLDPDGHKLEAHVGDLETRLARCRAQPYPGMRFIEN